MRCEDIRVLMSARLDGNLTPAEEGRLTEHLTGCPRCRHDMQDLESTVHLLRGMEPVPPPPDLAEKVYARLQRPQWGLASVFSLPQVKLAMAAGLLIVLTIYGVRVMSPPEGTGLAARRHADDTAIVAPAPKTGIALPSGEAGSVPVATGGEAMRLETAPAPAEHESAPSDYAKMAANAPSRPESPGSPSPTPAAAAAPSAPVAALTYAAAPHRQAEEASAQAADRRAEPRTRKQPALAGPIGRPAPAARSSLKNAMAKSGLPQETDRDGFSAAGSGTFASAAAERSADEAPRPETPPSPSREVTIRVSNPAAAIKAIAAAALWCRTETPARRTEALGTPPRSVAAATGSESAAPEETVVLAGIPASRYPTLLAQIETADEAAFGRAKRADDKHNVQRVLRDASPAQDREQKADRTDETLVVRIILLRN